MNRPEPAGLQPRKAPRQARSAATVEAICTATIQVLLAEGPLRLTTTRVAARAGVSVGTMYQYYPHKQALLFAVVERQLQTIEAAMAAAIVRLEGRDLETIAHGLADAWIAAKLADLDVSPAIYSLSAEFDTAELMGRAMQRFRDAIARLVRSASDGFAGDAEVAGFMLAAMLGGSARAVMELGGCEADLAALRRELPRACHGYLVMAQDAR